MLETPNLFYTSTKWYNKEEPLVYLGGTTAVVDSPMDSKWQDKAAEYLFKHKPDLNICDPRPHKKTPMTDEEKHIQAEYEISHIRLASHYGGLLFWFDGSENVNARDVFQFVEYYTHYKHLKKQDRILKIALGLDDNFPDREYFIHRVFNDTPEFVIATTLDETCQVLLDKLK